MSDLLPIELWKSAVMSPKETFAKEKANASIMGGAKQLAVGGAIAGFVTGLFTFNPISMVVMSILFAIIMPIALLIGTGIYWIFAKLLGGKGSFSAQYYVTALYAAPLSIPGAIPIVGMLVGLYEIYLAFLTIREVHELSTGKTIAVLLIPALIVIVLAILAMGAVLALIGGMGLSGLESVQG